MVRKTTAEPGQQQMLAAIHQPVHSVSMLILHVRRFIAGSHKDSGVILVAQIAMAKPKFKFSRQLLLRHLA
jgi:hypothetical protein